MSTPDQVALDLAELAVAIEGKRHTVVLKHGALLQTNVRRHASKPRTGPPGPRIQTGNYVRSINRRTRKMVGSSVAQVGTNAEQGRRLELGFTGTDSLGREYDQPPYPHFNPGLEETIPGFLLDLAAAGLPSDLIGFRRIERTS